MSALELAYFDDNQLSLTQLKRIKKEKDGLVKAKHATIKAKAEVETRLSNADKLNKELDVELLKGKDANDDL